MNPTTRETKVVSPPLLSPGPWMANPSINERGFRVAYTRHCTISSSPPLRLQRHILFIHLKCTYISYYSPFHPSLQYILVQLQTCSPHARSY